LKPSKKVICSAVPEHQYIAVISGTVVIVTASSAAAKQPKLMLSFSEELTKWQL